MSSPNLRTTRETLGLTLDAMAERLTDTLVDMGLRRPDDPPVHRQTVHRWEAETRTPPAYLPLALARMLETADVEASSTGRKP